MANRRIDLHTLKNTFTMDYKSIIKSWANDLDQHSAKEACLQFNLADIEESKQIESTISVGLEILQIYKKYIILAKQDKYNTEKWNQRALVCHEILSAVLGYDGEMLNDIKSFAI